MKRINVTFYGEVADQLEARMKSRGESSIVSGIRDLVYMGLEAEKAGLDSPLESKKNQDLMLEILKKVLACSLETRSIGRFLVEEINGEGHDRRREFLVSLHKKATDHVDEVLEKLARETCQNGTCN